MTKIRLSVLLGIAFMLGSSALAAENDVLREAQDRTQIEQLMWRYVRALDSYNARSEVDELVEWSVADQGA